MFDYQEPTGTGFLESQGALAVYRAIIHSFYSRFASLPGSGFTLREAFEELADGVQPSTAGVGWKAFPKAVIATNEQIDAQRFDFQDEYVEWRTEKAAGGSVTRITFTTEFPEYYQALATVSHDALVQGIQEVIPGANPTHMELYGPNFNPATASGAVRARRFRSQALANPWNNSQKGVLCLAQQFNTMNALFNLVGQCAIPRPDLPPGSVCANVGGACGSNRDSDPNVCLASQQAVRGQQGISLEDPVGVEIVALDGIWEVDGQQIDINAPASNQGAWTVSRNGRRAVLTVQDGLTLDGEVITTGTQVAKALRVRARVITAPETALPVWARIGNESLRGPIV